MVVTLDKIINMNTYKSIIKFSMSALLALMLLVTTNVSAQTEQTLHGVVVDSIGNPVVGALVNVSEISRIAVTDKQGHFDMKKVKKSDELIVSCNGYFTTVQKVLVVDDTIKIIMAKDSDIYMHTQPTAFQRKPRKITTEAISVVSGEELQKHPISVLQNAFTQTLNGVETYEWSSEPGWTESAMYIRGIRTMNANARAPLVIVDNVERDLSFLDAFPIESVTVLKDAAATAIYGMRGANGVILVTTRRGEEGKTKISLTQEVGFQMLSNKMETQDSYNMALTRNRVRYLDGLDPMYSDRQVEKYRKVCNGEPFDNEVDQYKYFNTNWFDVLYRNAAPLLKTNFQISGGNERAKYYLSFTYMRQEGMWNKEFTSWNKNYNTGHTLNRYNLRSNIDINVTKWLTVGLDLGGRLDDVTQPTTPVFNLTTFGAVEANPMEPVFCPNGEFYQSSTAQNAAVLLASSGQEKNKKRSLYATLDVTGHFDALVKGLKANLVISYDAYEMFEATQYNYVTTYNYDYDNEDVADVNDFSYTLQQSYQALTDPTALQREYSYNLNLRVGFLYNNRFGNHGIDANVFFRTYRDQDNGDWSATRGQSSNRTMSINGVATYDYANKYVLNASISRMGSDNFQKGDRWGTFWGVSAAWVISEEWKTNVLDLLKLRLSYGETGQSETGAGRYPYQSTYELYNGYGFGYSGSWQEGYRETLAGNANNKWETSKMLNLGLDFDLWHRRLYGAFDMFKEYRGGILVDRATIPSYIGVAIAQDSYGTAESQGWELNIGHEDHYGDFGYRIEANLTWNTNKITEMDETTPNEPYQAKTGNNIRDFTSVQGLYESTFNNTLGGWNRYKFVQWATDEALIATDQQDALDHPEKYPYNIASGSGQPLGTAVFKDLNGDRQINSDDMIADTYTIIPEFIPSVKIQLEWKGIDLGATLTAYLRRDVFISPAVSFSGWSNMGTHEVTESWGYYTDDPTDPRNVNAKYPRPTWGGFQAIDSNRDTETYCNDIWIQNGNFLSLRNIEIGYSLPARIIAKANMTKVRIYGIGYNLATWSNLPKGLDPEKPMSYCWWYPKVRSYSIGVNITF